jgi:hypothetical protein
MVRQRKKGSVKTGPDLCIDAKELIVKLLPPDKYKGNRDARRLWKIIDRISKSFIF